MNITDVMSEQFPCGTQTVASFECVRLQSEESVKDELGEAVENCNDRKEFSGVEVSRAALQL